jgi:hypothetical protein
MGSRGLALIATRMRWELAKFEYNGTVWFINPMTLWCAATAGIFFVFGMLAKRTR